MGLKAILLYDLKTKELDSFIWMGPGEPPPFIKPKMIPKPRRGRPRKQPKPDVS
jgi:hypothetical protein